MSEVPRHGLTSRARERRMSGPGGMWRFWSGVSPLYVRFAYRGRFNHERTILFAPLRVSDRFPCGRATRRQESRETLWRPFRLHDSVACLRQAGPAVPVCNPEPVVRENAG